MRQDLTALFSAVIANALLILLSLALCVPTAAAELVSEVDVVSHVEDNLARYMMKPAWCADAKAEVLSNAIVAPYAEAIDAAGAAAAGTKIVECMYPFTPKPGSAEQQGYAVMLDVPASVIGRWVYNACKTKSSGKFDACVRALVDKMRDSNGGQYPITGFVSEGPDGGLCKQHSKPVAKEGLIAFRDGVTIQFKEDAAATPPVLYCTTKPIAIDVQRELSLNEPAESAYHIARLSAADRRCYPGTPLNNVTGGLDPSDWQKISRDAFIDGLKTGDEVLFDFNAEEFAKKGKLC